MNPRILIVLLGLLASAVNAGQTTVPGDNDVSEYMLSNGLKLIVRADHRAPVVVSQVWYRVGSSYEPSGLTGVSHLLEHMMFKGTGELKPGEFSRIIASLGGRDNAFTGRDYTAYYQQLEKSHLERAFQLEADRMRNLILDDAELEKERLVVMEERRLRVDDSPQSLMYEHFNATAFETSPYQHPVIGWMEDIQAYRLDEVLGWYRRWYAPNNAIVVVVGDVEPEAVRDLAERYFGPIAPSTGIRLKHRDERPQTGPKRVVVRKTAQVPQLVMGYKVPSISTAKSEWEPYALTVLAAVLDGDESARLSRHLIRGAEVAAGASAGYSLNDRLTTLFTVGGSPASGRTVTELEQGLLKELQRLRQEPVTTDELDRVKTQVVAENVYGRDSMFYQAMRLGLLETVGVGWQRADEFVDRIRAVTAEQVQAVAREYLTEDRLTVAELKPVDASASGAVTREGGDRAH